MDKNQPFLPRWILRSMGDWSFPLKEIERHGLKSTSIARYDVAGWSRSDRFYKNRKHTLE